MSVRRILIYPDPFLRKPTNSIENLYKNYRQQYQEVVEDMRHSLMASGDGVALAANQIGLSWNGLIINSYHPRLSEMCKKYGDVFWDVSYINLNNEKKEANEGCLSFPGINIKLDRYVKIKVSAKDVCFSHVEFEVEGADSTGPARIFQHEIDHSQGILFVDKLPTKKRLQIAKSLQKR